MSAALAKIANTAGQMVPRDWRSLRWAELVVTDRRWAASLASLALGFGLFVGIALGPGSQGSQANPALVAVPPAAEPGVEEGGDQPAGGGGGSGDPTPPGGGGPTGDLDSGGTSDIPTTTYPPVTTSPPPPTTTTPPAEDTTDDTSDAPADDTTTDDDEEGDILSGTVVDVSEPASSYGVVATGGLLYAVHSKKLPNPGDKVEVPVRELANGTYAEDGKRKRRGSAKSARFSGVATFVNTDPMAPAYALSRLGASVMIHISPRTDGSLPELPKVGSFVEAAVAFEEPPEEAPSGDPTTPPDPTAPPDPTVPADPTQPPAPTTPVPPVGCARAADDPSLGPLEPDRVLLQTEVEIDPEPFDYSDLAGMLTAVCPDTGEIAISADSARSTDDDVVLSVGDDINLGDYEVGDSVAATANIAEDGALELAGLAGDEGISGADDAEIFQGDLAED